MTNIRDWLGFGGQSVETGHGAHGAHGEGGHGHTHGVIDPSLTKSDRGVWAIKWSGVWFGFPLADPIIGLLITVAIAGIVCQSAKAVITRSLDGVDPSVTAESQHAAEHVEEIKHITDARARWIGHELHADVAIDVDQSLSPPAAMAIARNLKVELPDPTPALRTTNVTFEHSEISKIDLPIAANGHEGHHAPEPFQFDGKLAAGKLAIVDTPSGERMQLKLDRNVDGLSAHVVIDWGAHGLETLPLRALAAGSLESTEAPNEPHSFHAVLQLTERSEHENLSFEMTEPKGHQH